MSRFFTLFLVASILLPVSWTGAAEYPDVASYRLRVDFEPHDRFLEGQASVRFAPESDLSQQVAFLLHGELRVDSILQGGQLLQFDTEPVLYRYDYSMVGINVSVTLGSTNPDDQLSIFYRGYFNPSQARSPSDYMRIDSTGVYLRAYYYSAWFPMFEEPDGRGYEVDFDEVVLSSPAEFSHVFVGHLADEIVADGRRLTIWRADNIHLSDAQCTVQKFERFSQGGVQVYSWTDSVSLSAAESIVKFVGDLANDFSERYGRAAESTELHVAEMPRYGDISSANVTTITYEAWRQFDKETWPKRFLGHELVHPFVRVPVAETDSMVAMVFEAFPSYFHLPVLEEYLGKDWYDDFLKKRENGYLRMKETGLSRRGNKLPVEKPLNQITFGDIGDYKDLFILSDRALLFMNFLRVQMGDTDFWLFSRELCNLPELTYSGFRQLILSHLPELEHDLQLWLSSNDYPERWHLDNLTAGN